MIFNYIITVILMTTFNAIANDVETSISYTEVLKGRLVGLFQHCSLRLIVLLPPNEFLYSSPEAPRTIQAGETSASEGRNYYQGI